MTQTTRGPDGAPDVAARPEVRVGARRIPGQMLLERLTETTSVERSWLQRLLGVPPLSADDWPWFQGALGEQAVGLELDRLPPGWHVFHSLPIGTGTSDVDHVLIGPAGVITVNTKHHRGARVWVRGTNVTVSGRREQYVRAAQHEARSVARILAAAGTQAPVTACLAIVAASSVDARDLPDGVAVTHARDLVRSLVRRPAVVAETDVETIAARLQAWSDAAVPLSPEVPTHWAALIRGQRQARVISRAWCLGGIAAALGVVVHVAPDVIASAPALIDLVH